MITFALILILFVLLDFLLESLEDRFSPEELIEMGIHLEGSLAVGTR
jgi:hypothetical protein